MNLKSNGRKDVPTFLGLNCWHIATDPIEFPPPKNEITVATHLLFIHSFKEKKVS